MSTGNFEPTAIIPAPPPRPMRPPRSLGDFATASVEEITEVVIGHFLTAGSKTWRARQEMQEFLGYLTGFPGDTWQECWEATGHDAGIPVGRVAGDDRALSRRLSAAAGRCFAMRLIRPTLLGLRSNTFTRYTLCFRSIANDPWLEEFCERVDQLPVGSSRRGRSKSDVCYALTVFGIDLDGLTPEALLHYAVECRAHALAGEDAESGTFSGTLAWPVLHEMGSFRAPHRELCGLLSPGDSCRSRKP